MVYLSKSRFWSLWTTYGTLHTCTVYVNQTQPSCSKSGYPLLCAISINKIILVEMITFSGMSLISRPRSWSWSARRRSSISFCCKASDSSLGLRSDRRMGKKLVSLVWFWGSGAVVVFCFWLLLPVWVSFRVPFLAAVPFVAGFERIGLTEWLLKYKEMSESKLVNTLSWSVVIFSR